VWLLVISIIIVAILLSFGQISDSLSPAPKIKLSTPILKSNDSQVLAGVQLGQQVVITTTISHAFDNTDAVSFLAIIEVRDFEGVTQYIAIQSGKLSAQVDDQKEIGSSWMPEKRGIYQLRAFAISDFENPMVLTPVYESNAYIGTSCVGSAACIEGRVTNIVDGDTLDLGDTRIRLTLVNTPEVGEPGYSEAKQFTSNLCPIGSEAIADEDDHQTQGSFGRMIAKVTCGDRVLNSELLNSGHAKILSQFCSISEFAAEDWTKQGCGLTDEHPEQMCDPSYPEVCIQPYPPDLDCGDITFRNFRVLPPDPHHFDIDKDGIGCES
jgi:micrococcal nuclease